MIEQQVIIKNICIMKDRYQKENVDPADKVINS